MFKWIRKNIFWWLPTKEEIESKRQRDLIMLREAWKLRHEIRVAAELDRLYENLDEIIEVGADGE